VAKDRSTTNVLLAGSGSVTLSLSLQLPEGEHDGPGVPVMLTCNPYRKDDLGPVTADRVADALLERGYAYARLDVRGTGSSGGVLPTAEYSGEEIEDLGLAVEWLAAQPWCSGAVGLWGISWSANNALLAATLDLPALRTCVVVHPCDDLFARDIHLIDGILHLDRYHIFIDLVNAVTSSPDYPTDDTALRERFDQQPWMMRWLGHRTRDAFWTERSLDGRHDQVRVPVLAVAGWYDGYRDCTFELLDRLQVPVQAVVGPWSHVLPHDGGPGPALDWFPMLFEWLDRWMGTDVRVASPSSRRVLLYRRRPDLIHDSGAVAVVPEQRASPASSNWYEMNAWPPPGLTTSRLSLGRASLDWHSTEVPPPAEPPQRGQLVIDSDPWTGAEAGHWWGDASGEQRGDGAVTFDSEPLGTAVEILGSPLLSLGEDTEGARLFARLVDVSPDGHTQLVSGGGVRLGDEQAGSPQVLHMRHTSWTFVPGHRIRLLLTTALWPLAWPRGRRSPVTLELSGVRVELPVVSPPAWERPWEPEISGSEDLVADSNGPQARTVDPEEPAPWMLVTGASGAALTWGPPGSARRTARQWDTSRRVAVPSLDWGLAYSVRNDDDQILAEAHGDGSFSARDRAGRELCWQTHLSISSNEAGLSYDYERTLTGDGVLLRRRRWAQTFRWEDA